jgi:pleckstrin homology domain-containing family H
MGQINMRDTRVEEVEQISDSDSDDNDKSTSEPTVGIFPNHVHDGPTYLIFPSKAEKENWLYELTVVSGGNPKQGTQFEQLMQRLMEDDGNPNSPVWKHPLMVHSKDHLTAPLTTFTSDTLQSAALKLFKVKNLLKILNPLLIYSILVFATVHICRDGFCGH